MDTMKLVELIDELNYNVTYRNELKDKLETFTLDLQTLKDISSYDYLLQIGISNEAGKQFAIQDIQEKINIITAEISRITTAIIQIKYQLTTILDAVN